MSEYQYYEWQTVDRILTPAEQTEVDRLSSHIDVTASQAVVTYNWSDFRHDPKEVLLKYFDAHFYLANWGSLRLMFRFPLGLVDEAAIEPYYMNDFISFQTIGQFQVLDLDFHPEDGGSWMEPGAKLSRFIQLRADILEGDFRMLYLAWLKAITFYDILDEDETAEDDPDHPAYDSEPPVPPGLKKLTPPLQNFVDLFEIDPFLVQAAAEASPDLKNPLAADYGYLVPRLPRPEADVFLARLAEGEAGLGLALRKRLAAFLPPAERTLAAPSRVIGQLLRRAKQLEKAEQTRRAEAARQRHIAEMKSLAAREEQAWKEVEDLLDNGRRIASVYDEATALLEKLEQLAVFQGTSGIFQARLQRLAHRYAARPALIGRWHRCGWV